VLAPPLSTLLLKHPNEASRQLQLSAHEMRLGPATLYLLVAARFSSYIRFFDEHDAFELRRLMSNARRKRIRVLTETKDPVSDATSIMSSHELSRYCFR
jgi:hypothetical protein